MTYEPPELSAAAAALYDLTGQADDLLGYQPHPLLVGFVRLRLWRVASELEDAARATTSELCARMVTPALRDLWELIEDPLVVGQPLAGDTVVAVEALAPEWVLPDTDEPF